MAFREVFGAIPWIDKIARSAFITELGGPEGVSLRMRRVFLCMVVYTDRFRRYFNLVLFIL